MTVKDKILSFLEEKGVKKSDFFDTFGIAPSNFRGQSKQTGLSSDTLVKILTVYKDLSAEWLLRGEGTMTRGVGDATVPAASPAVPEPSSPAIVSDLVSKIAEQAEEIGQLKERIFQLERKKGKGVSDALMSGTASAG